MKKYCSIFIFFTLIFCTINLESKEKKVFPIDVRSLEDQLWSEEKNTLNELEEKMISKIIDDPFSEKTHYILSLLYYRLFEKSNFEMYYLAKAEQLAIQLINLNRTNDLNFFPLAYIYFKTDNIESFNKVIYEMKQYSLHQSWRTDLLYMMQSYIKDEKLIFEHKIKKLLNVNKDYNDIFYKKIEKLMASKLEDFEIIALLESLDKGKRNSFLANILAKKYFQQKKYIESYKLYKQLIKTKNKDKISIVISTIEILYKHMNKPREALSIISKEKILSQSLSKEQLKKINFHIGSILLSLEKTNLAENFFMSSIKHSNDKENTVNDIYKTYKNLNKRNFALPLLKRVHNEEPGIHNSYKIQGDILSKVNREYHKAIKAYLNALLLNQKNPSLYKDLAFSYYKLSQFRKSLKSYDIALELESKNSIVLYNKACIHSLLGEKEESLFFLSEAISLDDQLRFKAQNESDFSLIKKDKSFLNLIYKTY